MVKECIEQGLCTNTLPQRIPQRVSDVGDGDWMFNEYCETCWIHCQQRSKKLWWHMEGIECKCENCSRR